MEKAILIVIKINLNEIKNDQEKKIEDISKTIIFNTSFNVFRKEFTFEMTEELRKKYEGASLKKRPNGHIFKESMKKTFYINNGEKICKIIFIISLERKIICLLA